MLLKVAEKAYHKKQAGVSSFIAGIPGMLSKGLASAKTYMKAKVPAPLTNVIANNPKAVTNLKNFSIGAAGGSVGAKLMAPKTPDMEKEAGIKLNAKAFFDKIRGTKAPELPKVDLEEAAKKMDMLNGVTRKGLALGATAGGAVGYHYGKKKGRSNTIDEINAQYAAAQEAARIQSTNFGQ